MHRLQVEQQLLLLSSKAVMADTSFLAHALSTTAGCHRENSNSAWQPRSRILNRAKDMEGESVHAPDLKTKLWRIPLQCVKSLPT